MPTPDETFDARRERAEDLVKSVSEGADLSDEAFKMSNEFTDEWTSRIVASLKRLFRR